MGVIMRSKKLGKSESWVPKNIREPITKLEGDVLAARYSTDGKVRAEYGAVAVQLGIPEVHVDYAHSSPASEQAYYIRCRALSKLANTARRIKAGDFVEDDLMTDYTDFAYIFSQFAKYMT